MMYHRGFAYLDLTFITRFTAHWFDHVIFVGPDLVIVDLQSADVPAPHVCVVEIIFPHLLKIHDDITVNIQTHTTQTSVWLKSYWPENSIDQDVLIDGLIQSLTDSMIDQHQISVLPSRRISVLVEINVFPRHSSEVGLHEELEQFGTIDGSHGITQSHHPRTQSFLHVMKPIGHAVDGIYHETHLGVLSVLLPERISL